MPVVVGGLIYVAFRSQDHLLFHWANALGLTPAVSWLRAAAAPLSPPLGWILYSLPDGLWLYAFAFFMASTWCERSLEASAWRLLPLALAVGSELAQVVGALPGTFDPMDLLTYAVAFLLAELTAARRLERSPA